ncbi:recombinase family protein [Tepidibacter formicigenes]|jgi:DNA invertase Pin-like site-specific DNA recombinase|uniref:Site-specific DNA recombinase n=1 Tax=Tepidibacter formicigenes DSM 15518 TaxID=1123349 RepID=A0A1M6T0C8_9FIRM|nr:recombinase family protein [Tepidibacter formicigenes]SHK50424.1 Site-specific DNA recombinase [Tepidibacter formicigenes DSM 15518]
MDNRIFAYIRVSSKDQNIERQIKAITDYCDKHKLVIDERDVYIDRQSGKDFNREDWKALKRSIRKGDTLIIKELDRLGRDMNMIKEEWNELTKQGVNIVVIDNPILNTKDKSDLERNLISNIVFELLTYMAEKERQKIKQRQKEGIEIAKAKGKHIGRPKAEYPSNWEEVYKSWKNKEITAVKAMEQLGLKKTTFYKLAKQWEQKQEDVK